MILLNLEYISFVYTQEKTDPGHKSTHGQYNRYGALVFMFDIVMIDSSYAIILFVFMFQILEFGYYEFLKLSMLRIVIRKRWGMSGNGLNSSRRFMHLVRPSVALGIVLSIDINLFDKKLPTRSISKRDSAFYGSLYEAIRHFVSDDFC